MQTCFFALSGVLPREEAIARSRRRSRRRTARRATRSCSELRRRRRLARGTLTGPGAGEGDRPAAGRRSSSPRSAGLRAPGDGGDAGDKGDLLPVSAFPVDGTWPTATARWEKRNIALEIPVWDAPSASSATSARWSARTPPSATKVYGERRWPARRRASSTSPSRAGAGSAYTVQVAPEDCTGCGLCVEVCPAKDKANPEHKAMDMAPQPPHREPRASNWSTSSSSCPRSTGPRCGRRRQGLAVPPAAVRVLRRLRRLRRDAVHQAAHPALRRPRCSSPTPPAARRSTAATCRRRRTP